MPHGELDEPLISPFHDFAYFDEDEGDVETTMPEAGWNQSPDEFHGDNRPTIRWGDVKNVVVQANPAGGLVVNPVLQLLDFYLQLPAVCMIRLSAQDVSTAAVQATDLITWTLLIGVGASTQTRKYQRKLSPGDGTVDMDLYLTMPIEHILATATLQVNADATIQRLVEVSAQVAPYTSAPWMAR